MRDCFQIPNINELADHSLGGVFCAGTVRVARTYPWTVLLLSSNICLFSLLLLRGLIARASPGGNVSSRISTSG